jgi:lipoate---protein ligase
MPSAEVTQKGWAGGWMVWSKSYLATEDYRVKFLDLTLPTSAENLALDEALLEQAESGDGPSEALRLWESPRPVVVVGRSSRVDDEVDRQACERRGLPILRRTSGGAAVVAGPGCLMYAVVLDYQRRPHVQMIQQAHCYVIGMLANAIRPLIPQVTCCGTSDLALDDRKFSGNSLRCKRTHLLYHGTLLYDFSLDLISTCLKQPPRQPEYRQGRRHDDFVTNLPLTADQLRKALMHTWAVDGTMERWPEYRTRELVKQRYSQDSWNLRR